MSSPTLNRSNQAALLSACLALLVSAGCSSDSDTTPTPDAGVDAVVSDDATQGDATSGDATACSPIDLTPLVVAEGYCAKGAVDIDALAIALRGDTLWTFNSTGATSFGVRAQTLSDRGELSGAPRSIFDFDVLEEGTFGTQYLAVSAANEAAVGYNTSDFTNPEGSVFWGAEGLNATETKANGSYDAAFLDEGTLLLNGKGAGTLEGQALYVVPKVGEPRKLIAALGEQSGLVIVGDGAVYVGGFFCANAACDAGENRVFGFSFAEVIKAVADKTELSTDEDGDEIHSGGLFDAAADGDDLLLATYDSATFAFSGVKRLPVTVTEDTLAPGTASDVITVPAGTNNKHSVQRVTVSGDTLGALISDGEGTSTLALIERN